MDQNAVHTELMMIKTLNDLCGKKTLNAKHKTSSLDSYEQQAYKNCVAKFIMTPQYIMNAMSQMGQGGSR